MSETDEQVVAAQKGNLAAFEGLMAEYQSMISKLLYSFAPNYSDLEDLVQVTFIRAYRKLGSWRAEKPFSHWLKTIAVNVGRDFYRRQKRHRLQYDNRAIETSPAQATGSLMDEHRAEIHRILSNLAEEDRTLLTLQYLDGMPLAEISEQLGWGQSKTKVRSLRARKKLGNLLRKHGYGP